MKILRIIYAIALPVLVVTGISCKKTEETVQETQGAAAVKDIDELIQFRRETRQLYNNRKFAELEAVADRVRSGKERMPDGDWKIYHFYDSLQCRDDEPESMWKIHDEIHKAWEKQFPQSITARVAHADFLTTYAWQARTAQVATKVTEEGWRLFRERLGEARTVLDQAKSLSPSCPMWWHVRQKVALGQSWPLAEYNALFKEAKAFEPEFFRYDFSRAKYLLPRWLGEPGDWEKAALDQIPLQGPTGSEIYARVVCEMESYHQNVFQESAASWRKARKGFDDLRAHYPASVEILNRYCRMSYIAGDRDLAKKLFGEIGANKASNVWYRNEFERAKAWALSGK